MAIWLSFDCCLQYCRDVQKTFGTNVKLCWLTCPLHTHTHTHTHPSLAAVNTFLSVKFQFWWTVFDPESISSPIFSGSAQTLNATYFIWSRAMREAWLTQLTSIPAAQTLGVWSACVMYITFGLTLYVASHSRKQQSTSVWFSNAYCHILISSTFIVDMKMTFLRNVLLHEVSVSDTLGLVLVGSTFGNDTNSRCQVEYEYPRCYIHIDFCQSTIN
jgi:hypothetical protein